MIPTNQYVLTLELMRKDLEISTDPPGRERVDQWPGGW